MPARSAVVRAPGRPARSSRALRSLPISRAVGPRGRVTACRRRGRKPGWFGGGLWLFLARQGRPPEAFPTFQKFLGTGGRWGGGTPYIDLERGGAAESGIRSRLQRDTVTAVPAPAQPGQVRGGGGRRERGEFFRGLKGMRGERRPGEGLGANQSHRQPADWSPWNFWGQLESWRRRLAGDGRESLRATAEMEPGWAVGTLRGPGESAGFPGSVGLEWWWPGGNREAGGHDAEAPLSAGQGGRIQSAVPSSKNREARLVPMPPVVG